MKKIMSVTLTAPAKVNLFLRVVRKRPDGYHDLQSRMQALETGDLVTLSRTGGGIEVTCDCPEVPAGPDNIAYKAALALAGEAGLKEGVGIHIKKLIPMAAGLGGGSSDAAATLKGMDLLFGLGVPDARLREIGLSLGADVPFFLSWPSALAEGVGEALTELSAPEETWVVLVNPGLHVSTAWVYASLNLGLTNTSNRITLPASEGRTVRDICAGPPASYLHNDLERVTVAKYPQIREIKERLVGEGADGALMSGSGPTVFGLFGDRAGAERAAARLKEPGWTVLVTRTISSWPEPSLVVL